MNAEKESQVVACWTQLLRESLGKIYTKGAFAKIPVERADSPKAAEFAISCGKPLWASRGTGHSINLECGLNTQRYPFERIGMKGPLLCVHSDNPGPGLLQATDEQTKSLARVANVDLRNHLVKFCRDFLNTSDLITALEMLRSVERIPPYGINSPSVNMTLTTLWAFVPGVDEILLAPNLRTNTVKNADSPWIESTEQFVVENGFSARLTRRWKNAKWEAVILFWGVPMKMVHQGDLPDIRVVTGLEATDGDCEFPDMHNFARAQVTITRAWVPMDTDNIICIFVWRKLSWRQKWENLVDDAKDWMAWGKGLLKFLREDAA